MSKKSCQTRADGAVVHRTKPLFLKPKKGRRKHPGYFVGSACGCRKVVLTERGSVSVPLRIIPGALSVEVPTQAHLRRVAAL